MRHTEETKKKIGNFFRGKKLSDEHRAKLRAASWMKGTHQKTNDALRIWHENGGKAKGPLGHAPWNKGKPCREDIRIKLKAVRMNNPIRNWKGGITPMQTLVRNSQAYQEWRKAVFERDDYRCFDCGARSEKGNSIYLHAHHIYPFAAFPRIRLMVENGITLCSDCHDKIRLKTMQIIKSFR